MTRTCSSILVWSIGEVFSGQRFEGSWGVGSDIQCCQEHRKDVKNESKAKGILKDIFGKIKIKGVRLLKWRDINNNYLSTLA